jgi:hypothetical protein
MRRHWEVAYEIEKLRLAISSLRQWLARSFKPAHSPLTLRRRSKSVTTADARDNSSGLRWRNPSRG